LSVQFCYTLSFCSLCFALLSCCLFIILLLPQLPGVVCNASLSTEKEKMMERRLQRVASLRCGSSLALTLTDSLLTSFPTSRRWLRDTRYCEFFPISSLSLTTSLSWLGMSVHGLTTWSSLDSSALNQLPLTSSWKDCLHGLSPLSSSSLSLTLLSQTWKGRKELLNSYPPPCLLVSLSSSFSCIVSPLSGAEGH
jgi:hypothetical protein